MSKTLLVTGRSDIAVFLSSKYRVVYCEDPLDRKFLNQLFEENEISMVLHLANYFSRDKFQCYRMNVCSIVNILRCMKQYSCNKLIFTSTSDVYDSNQLIPISEDGLILPKSYFALAKYSMENMTSTYKINYIAVRISHNTDPSDQRNFYSGLLGFFDNSIEKVKLIVNLESESENMYLDCSLIRELTGSKDAKL